LSSYQDKKATALSIIAYREKIGADVHLFFGKTQGSVVKARWGPDPSFGWDPIFQVDGPEKTYGEMKTLERQEHSHRTKAFKDLIYFINDPTNTELGLNVGSKGETNL